MAELGYPCRATLRLWWKDYAKAGNVPVGKGTKKSKYSDEQARRVVEYYLQHGRSLSGTMRVLGYPKGRQTLCDWIDELAPASASIASSTPRPNRCPCHESPGGGRAGGEGGVGRRRCCSRPFSVIVRHTCGRRRNIGNKAVATGLLASYVVLLSATEVNYEVHMPVNYNGYLRV
ncbi:MAG: hypothetical protein IKF14_05530 [Atopobiaceae bacterium]|nr:hypothetical protein [Atopobiaceae bacterium]